MLPCVEVDDVEGYRLGMVRDLSFCRTEEYSGGLTAFVIFLLYLVR
jgi:hypothetical protein